MLGHSLATTFNVPGNWTRMNRLDGNGMRVKHDRVNGDDLDGETNGRG